MSGPFCSQCGHVMKLTAINNEPGYFGGAHFDCTNCKQQAHVRPDGSGTMTLVDIHPTPRTSQDHHAYVDYWQAEKMMFLGMRCAAHYISREEYDDLAKQIADNVAEYKAEHPLPPPHFWSRLWARFA